MSRIVLPAGATPEQWHAMRAQGIGGSDVAAACGLSPWKTPFQLWLEKTGRVEPEFDERSTERMYWGTVLEPLLLEEFDRRHAELILTGGEGIYADGEHPWMLANVDGLSFTPDQVFDGCVEAKSGGHRQVSHWEDDQVPIHYVTQIQWYMRVLGAPRCYVVALLDTSNYLERVVERDDDLIGDLIDLAGEFWRCVEGDTPPEPDAAEGTRKALSRWPAAPGESVELDPLWHKHIARRHELTEQIKSLTTERDSIDNRLRAAMGECEIAELDGDVVARHKAPSKPSRSCSYEPLARDHPEVYASYVTEKPASRALTYKKTTPDRD